jgi:retron-type reverse transcriptase
MKKTPLYNLLSWEDSLKILSKLQLRLYKCVFTNNLKKALTFQKLILISKSCRLLAIREITQKDSYKNIPGSDGKTYLSFTERFQLNEYIKASIYNWFPSPIKQTIVLKKDGTKNILSILTISDRCWQCIVKFCLEPAHEARFNIRNLGYRAQIQIHQVQKLFLSNLCSDSYGKQKRILIINLEQSFTKVDINYLLKKLILPRSIKLGIFRLLNLGFKPMFSKNIGLNNNDNNINSLLCNILLDGIENIHPCIHFGYEIAFFLKPCDNETDINNKVNKFLSTIALNSELIKVKLYSSLTGFDFLGWNFKVNIWDETISVPSFNNYQTFLSRIKHIINNSNYGAVRYKRYNLN